MTLISQNDLRYVCTSWSAGVLNIILTLNFRGKTSSRGMWCLTKFHLWSNGSFPHITAILQWTATESCI